MALTQMLRPILPRPLRRRLKRLFYGRFKHTIEWEYMPQGWAAAADQDIKGWNVEAILESHRTHWPDFVRRVRSSGPLGFWYEGGTLGGDDPIPHNIHISFAYVLALVAAGRERISLLDWGGGIGHYYELSKALLPGVTIDYHCKEEPIFVEHGRALFPEAHFYADESCLDGRYDLILVSGSLHYARDWPALLARMARATAGALYVTRLPTIERAPSFVFVQRPYRIGYNTEYLGWCLNRGEFLAAAERAGLSLAREFALGEAPEIERAPEQNSYRGFLLRPR